MADPAPNPAPEHEEASPGYWAEVWTRMRRRPLAMAGLTFIVLMAVTALLAPAIVGTRPIVCYYKGSLYLPALAYFYENWEPTIFRAAPFRTVYPRALYETDPHAWAIWPLIYQDPRRPVKADEWEGLEENPQYGPPSRQHWFGTDKVGVDVFAVMIHATRITLLIGFVATGIAAIIGISLGAVAGYVGGWTDILISRLIEAMLCMPVLVLILGLVAIIERPTIWHTMAVIGVTSWPSLARLTRAEFIKLSNMDYVTAARALGAGDFRIMFQHILPNALAPVLVPIAFGIAGAILTESGLSFLGFGSQPDDPSWGTLINAARSNLQMWWMTLFPGLGIFLSVLSFNLVGEGLQESTDPRLREAGK